MKALRIFMLGTALALGTTATVAHSGEHTAMQQFVIEREIPGADKMTAEELREAAAHSNKVLGELGPGIEWVQSYVAGDKLYCVYNATSAELIERHAAISGFPANRITPVAVVIDPDTAGR
jgi:hypothetical protein